MILKNKNTVSKEFIVFTSCSMVLTALGIDIMLPAFADLRQHFAIESDSAQTSKLVTYFFMGQITQIVFGYLTDKMGRLPILKMGVIIYIICGFATVFAPTLSWMFLFRFISGMGAAAVFMTSIASVRDRYSGDAMARIMSFVLTIFLFTPIIAPSLGAWVLKYYSWQTVFLIPPSFAILVLFWSFRISESHPIEARVNVNLKETLSNIRVILTNAHFLRYTIVAMLLFSILSTYVSSSERIVGEIYQKPSLFPIIFGAIGTLMAIFAFGNSYLSKKYGAKKALYYLVVTYFLTAVVLLLLTFWTGDPPPIISFFVFMAILVSLTTAADPNSSAMALEYLGKNAGLAASVYGTIFFFVGSSISSMISSLLTVGVYPLVISATILSFICIILVFGDKHRSPKL